MNKKLGLIIGGVAAAILVVGGGLWWFLQPKDEGTGQQPGQNTSFAGAKDACAYLSDTVAVRVLGAGAEKGTVTPAATSDDVSVSTCTYSSKATSLEDVKNMRSATLLIRSPLTAAGAKSNEVPFDTLKTGAIVVSGYGEKAYWDPEIGQLNVLKGGAWLILSLGKSSLAEKSLDETKQLADLIVPQF